MDTRSFNRISPSSEDPVIRILAMADSTDLECVRPIICQLWFDNEKSPEIVTVYDNNKFKEDVDYSGNTLLQSETDF